MPPLGGETLRILQASSRVRPEAERVLAAVGLFWRLAAYFLMEGGVLAGKDALG